MEGQVSWTDGMVIWPQHLLCQEMLLQHWMMSRWAALGVPHSGLIHCQLNMESWNQGLLTWESLALWHPCGSMLNFKVGMDCLFPQTLALPEPQGSALDLWVWPHGSCIKTERMVHHPEFPDRIQAIPIQVQSWCQGFEKPENQTLCFKVHRLIPSSSGPHGWSLDDHFLPEVFKMQAHSSWVHRLHLWHQLASLACRLLRPEDSLYHPLKSFSSMLMAIHKESPRILYLECLRWCSLIDSFEMPAYDSSQFKWIHPIQNELERLSRQSAPMGLRLSIPRSSAQVFSVSIPSDEWNDFKVNLVWSRKGLFSGEESLTLRIGSLSQLPRLVRTALPGVPFEALANPPITGPWKRKIFQLQTSHPYWADIMRERCFALHSPDILEGDCFTLMDDVGLQSVLNGATNVF